MLDHKSRNGGEASGDVWWNTQLNGSIALFLGYIACQSQNVHIEQEYQLNKTFNCLFTVKQNSICVNTAK